MFSARLLPQPEDWWNLRPRLIAGQILWAERCLPETPQDVLRSVVVATLERDSLARGGTTPPQASHFSDRAIGTLFCHRL